MVIVMTVTLYNCSDDIRVVNKTLTDATSAITVQVYDTVDILYPTFMLDYNSSLLNKNYLWCDEFNRFYFINNITVDKAKKMYISCSVDVLKTYAGQLTSCPATVIRSQNPIDHHVYDDKLPVDPNMVTIKTIPFTSTPMSQVANSIVIGVN